MSPILIAGTTIVQLALICYSIAIITEQRKKIVSPKVLYILSAGVFFDILATILMIMGSSKGPFTLHGFLGYSSLLGMLIDCILIWRLKINSGINAAVPANLHKYSRFAYFWWIAAYVTGAMLVMFRHA